MKKNFVVVLSFITAIAVLFAGCGQAMQTPRGSGAPEQSPAISSEPEQSAKPATTLSEL